jgi:glucokinase
MINEVVIGIDLGGTNVRAGVLRDDRMGHIRSVRVNSRAATDEVLRQLYQLTDELIDDSVAAIGIGVPGLVDTSTGVVYDVINIPSWREVPLQSLMETRYGRPVLINNDANCFVLGEHYFGQGRDYDTLIGLNVGTGLGAGIIINNKLYSGANGGAGEFGMVDYLDKNYEYYGCGQFFQNVHHTDGEVIFNRAKNGDREAIRMFHEMGMHLGNAIRMMLYTFDTELIVMGGSVRHAWPFFSEAMWKSIQSFAFTRALSRLRIVVSELENCGVLGAAALRKDFMKTQ